MAKKDLSLTGENVVDKIINDFPTLGAAMRQMQDVVSEQLRDVYCYQKNNKKYAVTSFLIEGEKTVCELHYARPGDITFEELQRNNPSLSDNPIVFEKCPSHELPTTTWSDKLGQYPELKESDVMDVYVFINGVPWQRK